MIDNVYNRPCHGCEERTEECHGKCPRYKEWVLLNEEKKKQDRMDQDNRSAFRSPAYDRISLHSLKRRQQGRK